MFKSDNRLLQSVAVAVGITVLGFVGALLLFSRPPQSLTGTAPITPKPPTPITRTVVFVLTPTAEQDQVQTANCTGGSTTLEEARKHAGFKLLAPDYLPENLQRSLVTMNRVFPEESFGVDLYARNLMINAPAPWVRIYQRPAPASVEPLRLDRKASSIMIRGITGELIEPLNPPNTPSPPGPNPTLTAFAMGLVTPDLRTAVPRLPCAWVITRITTPTPWTPNPARTASAPPSSFDATSYLTLRWVESGVQIIVEGTYNRQELLKIAESLR